MYRTPRNDRREPNRPRLAAAYTLIELLITVAIVGIVAGVVLTSFEPGYYDQLQSTAQVVASDLATARSLAVANNSQYQLTFDTAAQRYWLTHSGAVASFDVLPESPYRAIDDPPTRHTTDLARLPVTGGQVELLAVRRVAASSESAATSIEFTPLGSLVQSDDCRIWLAIGRGDSRRYLPIELSAVTGLVRMGEFQNQGPASLVADELVPESAPAPQTIDRSMGSLPALPPSGGS